MDELILKARLDRAAYRARAHDEAVTRNTIIILCATFAITALNIVVLL